MYTPRHSQLSVVAGGLVIPTVMRIRIRGVADPSVPRAVDAVQDKYELGAFAEVDATRIV